MISIISQIIAFFLIYCHGNGRLQTPNSWPSFDGYLNFRYELNKRWQQFEKYSELISWIRRGRQHLNFRTNLQQVKFERAWGPIYAQFSPNVVQWWINLINARTLHAYIMFWHFRWLFISCVTNCIVTLEFCQFNYKSTMISTVFICFKL